MCFSLSGAVPNDGSKVNCVLFVFMCNHLYYLFIYFVLLLIYEFKKKKEDTCAAFWETCYNKRRFSAVLSRKWAMFLVIYCTSEAPHFSFHGLPQTNLPQHSRGEILRVRKHCSLLKGKINKRQPVPFPRWFCLWWTLCCVFFPLRFLIFYRAQSSTRSPCHFWTKPSFLIHLPVRRLRITLRFGQILLFIPED